MVRCVLSQLKPSELYILSCAKNVELVGLYPIQQRRASQILPDIDFFGRLNINCT